MITAIVSPYSFKGSILKLESLINFAKNSGAKCLLLCDENFHATVKFIDLCKKNDIKPIIGFKYRNKVFYARNTHELYELIEAYNTEKFEHLNLNFIPENQVYFAYYFPKQKHLYKIFCNYLGVEPVENGELKNLNVCLEVEEYKLYSTQVLPKAPDNFLKIKATPQEEERLKKEIDLIKEKNFVDYFYTIYNIVNIAEKHGIKVGPGRGSAVGSLLSYKLGITKINPIKFNLMFERFLNKGRMELPDIDLDIEDIKRKELIEKLREKYKYVYHISTFSNIGLKTLKKIAFENNVSLQELKPILNLPTHKSVHAAGIIISTKKILAPIKEQVIEWDMNSLQKIGYIKFDILGLRTLSILAELEKKLGTAKFEDKKSYNFILKGQTTGIFQLDSPLGKRISRLIKPENLEELSILLSLNRPGPLKAGIVDQYANAKWKKEKNLNLDVLNETNGVLIFQEQIMKIAMKYAGFTAEEADVLRKAVAKKDKNLMKDILKKFKTNLSKRLSKDLVQQIVDIIYEFSEYAFNKSHAVAYAHITYYLSFFKSHFPKVFFKVLLKHDSSKKEFSIFELQTLGFKVKLPNVNQKYEQEDEFIIPLTLINGINEKIEQQILRNSPYISLEDFVEKNSNLNFSVVESLIKAGAFDVFNDSRRKLLSKLKEIRSGVNSQLIELSSKLFGKKIENSYKTEQSWERCDMEYSVLGFSVSKPVENFKNYLAPYALCVIRNQKLAVNVISKGGYATDGISTFKLNVPDDTYTLIFDKKPEIQRGIKKVVYELKHINSYKDIERGNMNESVILEKNNKKIKILKSRPVLDNYNIKLIEVD
ncbi:helix-hairpin-helix domain-containing protein [Thermosipho atlanticus]|uniref:DNA-directed DNA polymerase n=1 Tax=Thermosipho atlanticus DSM 15807 TaxID=1123380 RepID=A0A1M5R499_9BACT|nr:PHP domain-containing protein [Thermosipho atlanticus]SHH20809.1 DNA polymerase-3 subunit alpha [Thermosipho atlanticus DSM 15807]